MNAPVRQRLRLRYCKDDVLMWIGHLDLMRLVLRMLRRINMPYATSGKFSPKPRITFGPPLSVGVTAAAELLDIELCEGVWWDGAAIAMARTGLVHAAAARDFVVDLTELAPGVSPVAQAVYAGRYRIGVQNEAGQALQAVQSGTLTACGRNGQQISATQGMLTVSSTADSLLIDGLATGTGVFNVMRLSQALEGAGLRTNLRHRCCLLDREGRML